MSIYAVLLDAVLHEHRQPGPPVGPGERLAELFRCRSQLVASTSSNRESDRVATAVADQLAYDVALIEFAQSLGIVPDPRFDPPQLERRRLEEALVLRGIPLYGPEEHVPPKAQRR
jgi:hypothetical protein